LIDEKEIKLFLAEQVPPGFNIFRLFNLSSETTPDDIDGWRVVLKCTNSVRYDKLVDIFEVGSEIDCETLSAAHLSQ